MTLLDSSIIEQKEYVTGNNTYRMSVEYDPEPEAPRENTLGTIVYRHNKYVLGDIRTQELSFDAYLEAAGLHPEDIVGYDLYLKDDVVLKLVTDQESEIDDLRGVGTIYVTLDQVIQHFGDPSEDSIEKAQSVLLNEIQSMNQFLAGDVYVYRLEKQDEAGNWETVFKRDGQLEKTIVDYQPFVEAVPELAVFFQHASSLKFKK